MFNLNPRDISKTNSNLCASVLNANRKEHDDELIYDIPSTVQINNPVYRKVLDLYVGHELDYTKSMTLNLCGLEHKLAYGGIHSAKENFIYEGEMWDADVTSYYPSMMIKYFFQSRNILSPDLFKDIYDKRVMAKKNKQKGIANALKLIINTAYGATKSKYNALFDPKMANQICITGQLLLIDLLEKLEPYITLVQSNTDGILFIPHNKERILEIIKEWEDRTGMNMEIEKFKKIWQKDVNNYIIIDENDNIKVKGGYVGQYGGEGLRNNVRILDIATVDYFVKGIRPEETIKNATDVHLFQYITKTGKTYDTTFWQHDGKEIEVNNVNRVYSSKNETDGNLYKTKYVGELIRKDSIANLPKHCIVDNGNKLNIDDIDTSWYVEQAYKRINDFLE
jgi:DNA polymerase elongation subunit (family B)